jgi:substrate-binding family protein
VPSAPSAVALPPGGGEPAPAPEGTGTGPEAQDPGPPPPFASPSSPAASSDQAPAAATAPAAPGSSGGESSSPAPRSAAPPASGPALRIGIVGGDAAQEAGFDAYLDLLNREGGVRGRPLQAVPVGPGAVDASTIATVNLSTRPLATPGGAPGWAGGAVLETLTATEDLLPAGGRVFSFASVPERQAHLAVDAVFPDAAPGADAVVYVAADGPYGGKVADAFRTLLVAKGVTVKTVVYDPARPLLPATEDAAFVSLDPPAAAAFARQARESGYRPARGIAGVASLFDPAVLGDLPEGARVVSPYVVPGGAEGDAIRSGAGGTSAGVLHGWNTAKVLAVALWRSGADSPDETVAALEGMAGYDSGLAPPYETRPQTRSRTPEGVVFEVRSGAFIAQGTFRRDPY